MPPRGEAAADPQLLLHTSSSQLLFTALVFFKAALPLHRRDLERSCRYRRWSCDTRGEPCSLNTSHVSSHGAPPSHGGLGLGLGQQQQQQLLYDVKPLAEH
ncbi:hypothetical protein EYF80_058754 [Liparis tanakae]|uniref:Uncharacterized protein n=1 Tax=Liparis tanakae TaxID=230148 RepID=A0A4Z2EQM7_9TELE|nr:hypothetical protein EYF80_058754 [Liparis tanakae]